MNVYVEYVLLDNLSIDCLIVYLACLTLKFNAKWYRILLGGMVGSVCALLTVSIVGAWLYVAKFLGLILMSMATVGIGKKLFWHILLTCAYTFMLGGAIVGFFNLSSDDFAQGIIYQSDVPVFVYALAVLVVVFCAISVLSYVQKVKYVAPNIVKVVVFLDKGYKATALFDSGNCATCNGLPLCFVCEKFSKAFAQKVLQGKSQTVQINTVLGSKSVLAVQGQVTFCKKTTQVYFALTKGSSLYDVVLSNQFCLDATQSVTTTQTQSGKN